MFANLPPCKSNSYTRQAAVYLKQWISLSCHNILCPRSLSYFAGDLLNPSPPSILPHPNVCHLLTGLLKSLTKSHPASLSVKHSSLDEEQLSQPTICVNFLIIKVIFTNPGCCSTPLCSFFWATGLTIFFCATEKFVRMLFWNKESSWPSSWLLWHLSRRVLVTRNRVIRTVVQASFLSCTQIYFSFQSVQSWSCM